MEPVATSVIAYEDFAKIELRVATVLEAAAHPNADKLLVLKVDIGGGQTRQILAGIRAYYEPAALLGKQVIVVANLAPRAMRGLESQGMVLAASTDDKSGLAICTLEKPLPAGCRVT